MVILCWAGLREKGWQKPRCLQANAPLDGGGRQSNLHELTVKVKRDVGDTQEMTLDRLLAQELARFFWKV